MRHAHVEIRHTTFTAHVNDVLEGRYEYLATLQAKTFLRRVLLSQKLLESDDENHGRKVKILNSAQGQLANHACNTGAP